MDFNLPPEDDVRRLQIRAWCEANPAASFQDMARQGYTAPHWQPPYGIGADAEQQLIVDEELRRCAIKRHYLSAVVTHNCGPMLLAGGTPEFQEHLWPALAAEEIWCQAYSEPEAGSDMASGRTRAERDGDFYIVNGSKIWVSFAHIADYAFTLVRTDPSKPKHRGLSMLMIDLSADGVEVRPIHNLTGRPAEFNQIFFTDVRVPVAARIGEEGEGWRYATQQMSAERILTSTPQPEGSSARALVEGLAACGRLDDDLTRQRAARNYIEGEVLRLLAFRDRSERLLGRPTGPEGSIMRLLNGPHIRETASIAADSIGAGSMVPGASPFGEEVDEEAFPLAMLAMTWSNVMWIAPMYTIAAGTEEVQKNIIAEQILGFPRELDPTVKVPWSEISRAGREAS